MSLNNTSESSKLPTAVVTVVEANPTLDVYSTMTQSSNPDENEVMFSSIYDDATSKVNSDTT